MFLLGLTIALLTAGQLSAKYGVMLNSAGGGGLLFLCISYCCYFLRGISWTGALRKLPVSRAYPVLALAYPLILFLSRTLFGETFNGAKLTGAAFISMGVLLTGLAKHE